MEIIMYIGAIGMVLSLLIFLLAGKIVMNGTDIPIIVKIAIKTMLISIFLTIVGFKNEKLRFYIIAPIWRRKENVMKAFNYTQKENMDALPQIQQKFTAKMIVKEVQKIAREHNISEADAYWAYTHGLYGADRDMQDQGGD